MTADLSRLPDLPRDADGPVFEAPWQAQAFALTLALHQKGLFSWAEWASALSGQIKTAQVAGDPDTGETYYHHWLAALEEIVIEKGVSDSEDLHGLAEAWQRAARATPHGEPIVLGKAAE